MACKNRMIQREVLRALRLAEKFIRYMGREAQHHRWRCRF